MGNTPQRTLSPAVEHTPEDRPGRPRRRRRILLVLAALAVLGLAAFVLGVVRPGPAAPTEPEQTMTAIQIIPLVILVVMFVVATRWPLNIGVMGLVASFGVGYFMLGMTDKEILAEFPASIVLTIIGVTYFFSMAQRNGTIDVIVQACVRLVRGRTLMLPWVFFLMAAALTALGTFSPAAVALLAPAAIGFAYESRIHPVLMGAFIINGAHAGGFPRCPWPGCWCTTSPRKTASPFRRVHCSLPALPSTSSSRS